MRAQRWPLGSAVQARRDRDPQHLPLLLGCLRHHHVLGATSPRTRRPRSSTSRAIPTIRPIAARCARKGAALLDFVNAPTRTQVSDVPATRLDQFERVSWDVALDRIAGLMKDDRDANFIAKNKAA